MQLPCGGIYNNHIANCLQSVPWPWFFPHPTLWWMSVPVKEFWKSVN